MVVSFIGGFINTTLISSHLSDCNFLASLLNFYLVFLLHHELHCVSKKLARNIMPHNSRECGPML